MYSHQYSPSYVSMSRENANNNAQSLGRPASMPSLYPSLTKDNSEEYHHPNRSSLDGNTELYHWDQPQQANHHHHHHNSSSSSSSGWNHNRHGENNTHLSSSSSPPSTLASTATTMDRKSTNNSMHDLPSIDKHYTSPTSPPSTTTGPNMISTSTSSYNSPTYFVSPTTTHNTAVVYNSNNGPYPAYGMTSSNSQTRHSIAARPKLTTTLWEDEGTICYQVDANGICVARRQDNDMINGTKLLNVAGMSRGKRDGILKNEKGRVVVKVGAMHLKGVWITFARAKLLAAQYKIQEILYPLFVDDPSVFLYATALHNPMATSRMNGLNGYRAQQQPYHSFSSGQSTATPGSNWDRHDNNPSSHSSYKNNNAGLSSGVLNSNNEDMFILSSQVDYNHHRSSVGGLVGYGNSSNQQQRSSTYFGEELFDESKSESVQQDTFYGNKSMLSPTSSEAGKSSSSSSAFHLPPSRTSGEYEFNTDQRRQSLVMSAPRVSNSPRHHPYMSPGKAYPHNLMSSLQSFRSTQQQQDDVEENESTNDNNTNRHPW